MANGTGGKTDGPEDAVGGDGVSVQLVARRIRTVQAWQHGIEVKRGVRQGKTAQSNG